jgi:hypothetical protein
MGMEGGSTKGGEGISLPPYPGPPPLSWFWANPRVSFPFNPFFDNLLEEDNKLKTTWYNTNPTPHDIPSGPKMLSGLYTKNHTY